jgi:glycosyltransferase involved in cell wall biosynthesis
VIDGLALGVLPDVAEALSSTHKVVALVHHPLAFETGLGDGEARALQESERAALRFARHVVATSPATARLLADEFGVPPERLTVVRPGTDRPVAGPRTQQCAAPQASGNAVALLAVGSIVPRKGYDVLIDALGRLRDLSWRLIIVGDRSRDAATAQQLDAQIARLGLDQCVAFTGAIAPERLTAYYGSADLFVLASRFEGYGMAYAEAIAHGLAVVGTTAGAIPDTVPAGAGVLVPPDDAQALALVLRRLIEDGARRDRLAGGARAAAASLPTWPQSAALFAQVLDGLS